MCFDFVKKMERERLEKLKHKTEKEKAEKEKEAEEKVSSFLPVHEILCSNVNPIYYVRFCYAFMHGVAWTNRLCEFSIGIINRAFPSIAFPSISLLT